MIAPLFDDATRWVPGEQATRQAPRLTPGPTNNSLVAVKTAHKPLSSLPPVSQRYLSNLTGHPIGRQLWVPLNAFDVQAAGAVTVACPLTLTGCTA
jgi:hypothetical protein